jgi:hypothetical protein
LKTGPKSRRSQGPTWADAPSFFAAKVQNALVKFRAKAEPGLALFLWQNSERVLRSERSHPNGLVRSALRENAQAQFDKIAGWHSADATAVFEAVREFHSLSFRHWSFGNKVAYCSRFVTEKKTSASGPMFPKNATDLAADLLRIFGDGELETMRLEFGSAMGTRAEDLTENIRKELSRETKRRQKIFTGWRREFDAVAEFEKAILNAKRLR